MDVYRLTRSFPSEERFLLTFQTRRGALSVPANIAEGFGRRAPNDKAHFYGISQGSLEELGYLMGYASDVEPLREAVDRIGAMLRRLIERTLEMPPYPPKRRDG